MNTETVIRKCLAKWLKGEEQATLKVYHIRNDLVGTLLVVSSRNKTKTALSKKKKKVNFLADISENPKRKANFKHG